MEVFSNKEQITSVVDVFKSKECTIGFVPTMGALHKGHLALVEKALTQNDKVFVSVFVNPTQFNNSEDLLKYPRTLEKDILLLQSISEEILVFAPSVDAIYEGNKVSQKFDFDGLEHVMEGRFRPGHFDGVGTVVKRLFDIVRPNNAYFGEKDFQQLQIIKKLVKKYAIPVNVVGCEIHREPSGLAMSSRNMRLADNERKAASLIYKILKTAKSYFGTKSAHKVSNWVIKQFENHELLKLEYFVIADVDTLKTVKRKSKNKKYRAFIAVYVSEIRLIDNIALN